MTSRPGWTVLLLGGASGVGKSTAAERIGRQLGYPWLQVDDLRLAAQFGGMVAPDTQADLFFFLHTPSFWRLPPELLRDRLIAVGVALIPALAVIIEHHVGTGKPLVIEGDGIHPALFALPAVRAHIDRGLVRGVFLHGEAEEAIAANLRSRGRRDLGPPDEEALRAGALLNLHYGTWLCQEALRCGLPTMPVRPWETLVARLLAMPNDAGR